MTAHTHKPLRTYPTGAALCRCGALRQADGTWQRPLEEGLVTVQEAAKRSDLCESAIRQAIAHGRLQAAKPTGASYWLIDVDDLAAFASTIRRGQGHADEADEASKRG